MNTKELPELLDPNNLQSQESNEQQLPDKLNEPNEPNEVTVTLTTNEDTLRAMELLFSPNLSELKENQPEMFQYYSLFGAAEGDGLRHQPHVGKSEFVADDGAPAVGPKRNRPRCTSL